MEKIKVLWADDEIDLLKPHIMFLEEKGHLVDPVASGGEAIEKVRSEFYDIVFLDENMPGLTGLETLEAIKKKSPGVPVIMITKSEEEFLMDDAIGSQISDYLIKPVNPKQILLSIKKFTSQRRLVSEKITQSYQKDFRNLAMKVNEPLNSGEWIEVYKDLVYWDMELEKSEDENMKEVMETQKTDANANFSRFVDNNYFQWLREPERAPLMSHNLLFKKVLPELENNKPTFLVLLDNFRYDQWKAIQPAISQIFNVIEDDAYYSILPTATNYARNSIFSGMLPLDIEKRFPRLWRNDEDEGGKNLHEEDFFGEYFKRMRREVSFSYNKVTRLEQGRSLTDNVNNFLSKDLVVIIYNFVDLLSHVRTEMEVLKELAEDEAAYRSLTQSWFEHSPLLELFKSLSNEKIRMILTTDHGSVRVRKPSRVIGDRNTTTNVRYKSGKNLNYQKKDVFSVKKPEEAYLPRQHVSSSFIFGKEDFYFVYPNNYNYYVNFFKDTFQHGGISLEEMIVPVITLETK